MNPKTKAWIWGIVGAAIAVTIMILSILPSLFWC